MLVLVQRPQHKSTPDPVAAPKNIPFDTIFIEFGDTKKCCTFSGLELAPKSRKKLIGALSCMHKGPKCIQSLWDHPKKIPFVQKHKEGAICAILREKPHFWPSQRLKRVLFTAQFCARLRTGPIIMQIPRGYQKKKFIVEKVCDFVDKVGILSFERGWVGPSKKCWFWCNGPSTKAPQIPLRHQKTFHLTLFLSNLAILKSAALFQGLN